MPRDAISLLVDSSIFVITILCPHWEKNLIKLHDLLHFTRRSHHRLIPHHAKAFGFYWEKYFIKKEQTGSNHLRRAPIINWFLYFHANSLMSLTGRNNQWKKAKRTDHLHFAKSWHHQLIPLFHLNSLVSLTEKRTIKKQQTGCNHLHCTKKCHAIIGWFLYFYASNFMLSLRRGFDKKLQTRCDHLHFTRRYHHQLNPIFMQSICCPSLRKLFHNKEVNRKWSLTFS